MRYEGGELIARFTDSGYETDASLHDEELAGKTFLKLEKEDGKIKVTYEGKDGGQMKEYTMTGQ